MAGAVIPAMLATATLLTVEKVTFMTNKGMNMHSCVHSSV